MSVEMNANDSVEVSETFESRMGKTARFLKEIVSESNQNLIEDRRVKIQEVIVEPSTKTITRELDGVEHTTEFRAAAVASVAKASFLDGTTHFEYGVWLRHGNGEHNISHEYFHALSGALQGEQVEQNVYARKVGLMCYYDQSTDGNLLASKRFSEDGFLLNEGVTDYLTYRKDNQNIYDSRYLNETILAQFLIGSEIKNNDLINAYASDTVRDIEAFKQKFEANQSIVKYSDLSSKELVSGDRFKDLLGAAIDFRVKLGGEKERAFYSDLISHMETNPYARDMLEIHFEDDFLPMIVELKTHVVQGNEVAA